MNYFAIQSLFSCFLSMFIGFCVIEKNSRAPLNRLFLVITLLTSYLFFANFGIRIAKDIDSAIFWHKLLIVWPFAVALSLHLVLVFAGATKFLNSRFGYPVIYLPPLLLVFAEYYSIVANDVFVLEYWRWERHPPVVTLFSLRNFVWTLIVLSIELTVCLRYLKKAESKRSIKQAKYFILGLLIPLGALLINGMLLPKLGIKVPGLISLCLLIGILFLGYGIVKYRLLSLTPESIAQDTIKKMNTGLFLVDANKIIVLVNKAASVLLERKEKQLIGKSLDCVMPNSGETAFFQNNLLEILEQTKSTQYIETAIQTKTRQVVPVAVSVFTQRENGDFIIGYVIIVSDISNTKKTENALVISEEKYKSVLESVMEGYYEVDLTGKYIFINQAYFQITGYSQEEIIGKSYRELTSEETAKRLYNIFNKVFQTGKSQKGIRFKLIKKNKETVILEISATLIKSKEGNITGFSGLTSDASNKVQIEEMLIQSEKMLTLGGLSAGIAHEINNPLAAMIQTIQVVNSRILNDLPKNIETANSCGFTMGMLNKYLELRDIPKKFNSIMYSGRRIVEIVENILSFSRKGNAVFQKHDLTKLLDNTVSLVASEYVIGKKYSFHDITIIREYEKDIPMIPCEGSKLQQVFFNLLKNGAQAMYENHTLSKPRNFYLRIKKQDGFIQIEIEDTGKGMEKETCDRIFEPFFTTKKTGTGLGLSISNYIVTKNHHGTMKVEAQPGKGTRFIIRLPYKYECLEENVGYN